MVLKIYIFIILVILFICHFVRRNAKIRKYNELLQREECAEFLESRTFEVIDKFEEKRGFKPTKYCLRLKSVKRNEEYIETLEVSMGTFFKTKLNEVKVYDIYSVYGSSEVLLIDKSKNKSFFFDEVKVLLVTEYVLLSILACLIVNFFFIEMLLQ